MVQTEQAIARTHYAKFLEVRYFKVDLMTNVTVRGFFVFYKVQFVAIISSVSADGINEDEIRIPLR